MNSNSLENMTLFEHKILTEYVDLNDILFARIKDEEEQIFESCQHVIRQYANSNPAIIQQVRKSYIEQTAALVEELRKTSGVSRECVADITKYLHRYYATVFSGIGMIDSPDGQISSYNLCANYSICKNSLEELEMIFSQKQQLRDRK